MEPEDASPHSHMPGTCPYPEPARFSSRPNISFLTIHLNIIIPSTSGSSKWSRSFRFPHKNPVYASPFRHTWYMPCPSHSSRFSHLHNFHFTNTGVGKKLRDFRLPSSENEICILLGCYQLRSVVSYRRFGTTHQSHLQGSNSPEM